MASKRDRLRAAQLAQLEAEAALAEVEKAAPKRKKRSQKAVPPRREAVASKEGERKKGPSDATRGGRRLAFRAAQLAQLEAQAALAEVEKAVPPRREAVASKEGERKKGPSDAMRGGRRLAFGAAQKAQLETPPALGEADKALLGASRRRRRREAEPAGPRATRRKAGFQSLLSAQLDNGPVLAEVERELPSLPRERGPLAALGVALARLRASLASGVRKAWRREAEPEAVEEALVVEEASALAPEESLLGRLFGGMKARLAAARGDGERGGGGSG